MTLPRVIRPRDEKGNIITQVEMCMTYRLEWWDRFGLVGNLRAEAREED